MSSSLKPIKLYSHASGPNPWKVAMVLEELNIPYETEFLDFSDLKKSPFVDVNPNGRVPAIQDPNTSITLWESGAILEYLAETYDTSNEISYPAASPLKHQTRQWLFFQASGQGPYYGQKAWFSHFHSEKNIKSAIERYSSEIERVVGVVNNALKSNGTGWLVGDKCTYADLSFVAWDSMLGFLIGKVELEKLMAANPEWTKWHEALMARPAVKKVNEAKAAKAQQH